MSLDTFIKAALAVALLCVAGVFAAFISHQVDLEKQCKAKGGVLIRGVCFDAKAVLKVKETT